MWHCFHVHLRVRRNAREINRPKLLIGGFGRAVRTSNPGPRHRCLLQRQGQLTMPTLLERMHLAILTVDTSEVSGRLYTREKPVSHFRRQPRQGLEKTHGSSGRNVGDRSVQGAEERSRLVLGGTVFEKIGGRCLSASSQRVGHQSELLVKSAAPGYQPAGDEERRVARRRRRNAREVGDLPDRRVDLLGDLRAVRFVRGQYSRLPPRWQAARVCRRCSVSDVEASGGEERENPKLTNAATGG